MLELSAGVMREGVVSQLAGVGELVLAVVAVVHADAGHEGADVGIVHDGHGVLEDHVVMLQTGFFPFRCGADPRLVDWLFWGWKKGYLGLMKQFLCLHSAEQGLWSSLQ